jgi:hypothetical protein
VFNFYQEYKSVHYLVAKAKDNCGQYLEFQKDMGFLSIQVGEMLLEECTVTKLWKKE